MKYSNNIRFILENVQKENLSIDSALDLISELINEVNNQPVIPVSYPTIPYPQIDYGQRITCTGSGTGVDTIEYNYNTDSSDNLYKK